MISDEMTAPRITITVIIATYNRAHLIAESLDSVLSQSPHEVIVVNDGSADNTAEVLAPYFDRIRYLWKENEGKPIAVNYGAQFATGSHLLIFDDDDILLPGALDIHSGFLERNPEFDYSYASCYYFEGDFDPSLLDSYLWLPLPQISSDEYLVSTLEDLNGSMQGMLIPKFCFDEVGGFDPELLRTQDHDLAIRLARRFRPGRIDEPTFAVRQHDQPRGPGFAQHEFSARRSVWRSYQQRIFSRIRQELALHEYLADPAVACDDQMACSQRRQALVQRAYIMSNRGLYDYALDDLCSAFSGRLAEEPLSVRERNLISQMTYFPDMRFFAPAWFFRRMGQAVRRNKLCFRYASRGLYWTGVRSRNSPRAVAKVANAIGHFMVGWVS